MITKFEYKTIPFEESPLALGNGRLDVEGQEGWGLVSVIGPYRTSENKNKFQYTFKRQIQ
jgi:hypothetical protein